MALHPRTIKVQRASLELQSQALDVADRNGLTYIETVQALADAIQRISRDALRLERHPNSPDTPADVDE